MSLTKVLAYVFIALCTISVAHATSVSTYWESFDQFDVPMYVDTGMSASVAASQLKVQMLQSNANVVINELSLSEFDGYQREAIFVLHSARVSNLPKDCIEQLTGKVQFAGFCNGNNYFLVYGSSVTALDATVKAVVSGSGEYIVEEQFIDESTPTVAERLAGWFSRLL